MYNKKIDAIVAPVGGFGNHVRWLLLLDKNFIIDDVIVDQKKFNEFYGNSWPSYDDYINKNVDNVPQKILQEIADKINPINILFTDVSNKINFIKNYVYAEARSYNNWLIFEWYYWELFNNLIVFKHTLTSDHQVNKLLILSTNPHIAYKNYFKFNSCLNNQTKEKFSSNVLEETKQNILYAKENNIPYLLLDSSVLWNPILNFKFYKNVVDFFELDNNYTQANYIHTLWFNRQLASEKDFIENVLKLYK
jgi:hypothetical protein